MPRIAGKRIILFRFHKDIDIAQNRIALLRYYNPDTPVYVLYGGEATKAMEYEVILDDLMEHFWVCMEDKPKDWKWLHTDIMTKQWFREVGRDVEFSYEYDLLTLAPLIDIYPSVEKGEIALSAAERFTREIETRWSWTSVSARREKYSEFQKYMHDKYSLERQEKVCLGPGPLLSREFLERFAETEDIDLVHEEIALPAYAEAFSVPVNNNGLHPGFFKHSPEDKYFTCMQGGDISRELIEQCREEGLARRAFHPVKAAFDIEAVRALGYGL